MIVSLGAAKGYGVIELFHTLFVLYLLQHQFRLKLELAPHFIALLLIIKVFNL